MDTLTENGYTYRSGYKWLYVILGILLFIFGIAIFRYPVSAYFGLAVYFSIIILAIGITELITAIQNKGTRYWGWGLAFGIIDIIFGILLLANPLLTEQILPFMLGFVLMFKSVDFISDSLYMYNCRIRGWGWIFAGGLLTLIFSFLIVFFPIFGVFNIIVWTGLSFIFAGISSMVYAFVGRR